MTNHTDTNQASEDAKTARQILIEYSNQFINPMLTELEPELDLVEALEGIEAIIRTEKLKLLAEVRERVVGSNETDFLGTEKQFASPRQSRNSLRAEQMSNLTKLEAEL